MNTKYTQNEINIGVDTGKTTLDIYIHPSDIYFSVSNDAQGIRQAISEIKKHKPQRIVIEATGRLEHEFVLACATARLPICVANPFKIKRFAGAIGQHAKTDRLDARLIALFAHTIRPELTPLRPAVMRLMSDLLARRRQLIDMQTMKKNRLQIMPEPVASYIKPVLTALKNQLEKVEKKLINLIQQCEQQKAKLDIIQSVPGVGNIVAFSLISDMPELGFMTNKQAASMVGVAPMNRESGAYKGRRMIRGGRGNIRTVMYMAMMSAIQCNPVFKQQYQRLVALGKPKKVAIIACLRKLIVILNSMVRDGTMWQPDTKKLAA